MATNQSTVYVIDDDASVRKSFARLLRSANLDVEAFASPEEFLASPIQTVRACILVDLRMRGATGFDLQKRILELDISLPVIVISASDDEQVRETARRLGAVSFFRKPVDDQALLDAVLWAISVARNGKNG
jgi:FixJ family two-component response regulator